MNRLNLSLLLSVWIVFPAWSQAPAIPDDWVAVKAARNAFEFKALPDLEKQPGFSSKIVKIDGKTAKVVTFDGVAAVHFPKVKDRIRLTAYVRLKKKEAKATAISACLIFMGRSSTTCWPHERRL